MLFCICFTAWHLAAASLVQSSDIDSDFSKDQVYIRHIRIEGNIKTNERIVRRELDMMEGDSVRYEQLELRLLMNRNRIFNTNLFTYVALELPGDTLKIYLKERFYTYPLPILELADRNFNEWWQLRNHDPGRINFGINFVQKNVRGRNEMLRVKLQAGFNQKAEISYSIPYIDLNQKLGLLTFVSCITEKKIAYKTSGNILTYTEGNGRVRERFQAGIVLSRRGRFYTTSSLGLTYSYNHIADTVALLNPNYFLKGRTNQRYFALKYTFIHDRRDIRYYPMRGHYFSAEAEKLGLLPSDAINQFNMYFNYAWFKKVKGNFFVAAALTQKISLPKAQPYYNYRALGYNAYAVSGYELYVIDGQTFSMAKLNAKYRIFNLNFRMRFLPLEKMRSVPLAVYLKIYSDGGYVLDNTKNPENMLLSNKFLWGNGIGLDFVSYYDLVLRVEYSINRSLQQGLFLHMKAAI